MIGTSGADSLVRIVGQYELPESCNHPRQSGRNAACARNHVLGPRAMPFARSSQLDWAPTHPVVFLHSPGRSDCRAGGPDPFGVEVEASSKASLLVLLSGVSTGGLRHEHLDDTGV